MFIHFSKYHGAGNDFVFFDNRQNQIQLTKAQRQQLCHRKFGIGCDGIFEIHCSDEADFRTVYYKANGEPGCLCGNGSRCALAFAIKIGVEHNMERLRSGLFKGMDFSTDHSRKRLTFDGYDGIHYGGQTGENGRFFLTINDVALENVKIYDNGDFHLETGSPNHVKFVEDVMKLDAREMGRQIHNELYGGRICNVQLVTRRFDLAKQQTVLRTRSYEFGVEDLTMACGTGAVAVSIVDYIMQKTKETNVHSGANGCREETMNGNDNVQSKTVERIVEMDGGTLKVTFSISTNGMIAENIILDGPVKHVYDGDYAVTDE